MTPYGRPRKRGLCNAALVLAATLALVGCTRESAPGGPRSPAPRAHTALPLATLLPDVSERRPLARLTRSLAELTRGAEARGLETHFRVPSAEACERFERCMRLLVLATMQPEAVRRAHVERAAAALWALGFELDTLPAQPLWLIRGREGKRHGAGLYVIRHTPPPPEPLVVQAPHRFFDRHTGRIARALFTLSGAQALMLNTVHRYARRPESDFAHTPRSFFLAATRAVASAWEGVRFVQLHGFSLAGHPELGDTQAILSSGVNHTDLDPRLVARLRAALTPARLGVYGQSVHTLGGTTNVQARAIRRCAGAHFYHLELAATLRRRLAFDRTALRRLAMAIAQPARDPARPGTRQANAGSNRRLSPVSPAVRRERRFTVSYNAGRKPRSPW